MYSDIILWIGLPGSGKTYYAKKYCDIVIDDITSLEELPDTYELQNKKLGITDVNFCDSKILSKALDILINKYPDKYITTMYFEKDVDKCRSNVLHRNDGRNVEGTIRRFERVYNPPFGSIKIWSG